jgi:hypothetical protein
MILLTNAPPALAALKRLALDVVGHRPMVATSASRWLC